jgi:DNA-3-methyladenine glycosylase I
METPSKETPTKTPPVSDLVIGADGRPRCAWGASTPDYQAYHDDEWGQPVHDDTRILEKLCLEGFQSGLSWLTILRKRDNFRAAFKQFDAPQVARFGERDIERLLGDAGIVRHRGKIEATIANARALVGMHERGESLDTLLWSHAPTSHQRPASFADLTPTTRESIALSKALGKLGFKFVGPTTVYSAMESLGVVNDHLAGCDFGHHRES